MSLGAFSGTQGRRDIERSLGRTQLARLERELVEGSGREARGRGGRVVGGGVGGGGGGVGGGVGDGVGHGAMYKRDAE